MQSGGRQGNRKAASRWAFVVELLFLTSILTGAGIVPQPVQALQATPPTQYHPAIASPPVVEEQAGNQGQWSYTGGTTGGASTDVDTSTFNMPNATEGEVQATVDNVTCPVTGQITAHVDGHDINVNNCQPNTDPNGNPMAIISANVTPAILHTIPDDLHFGFDGLPAGSTILDAGAPGVVEKPSLRFRVKHPLKQPLQTPSISAVAGSDPLTINVTWSRPEDTVNEIQIHEAFSASAAQAATQSQIKIHPGDAMWTAGYWLEHNATCNWDGSQCAPHYYVASYYSGHPHVDSAPTSARPHIRTLVAASRRGADWINVNWTPLKDIARITVTRNQTGTPDNYNGTSPLVTFVCPHADCTSLSSYNDTGLGVGQYNTYHIVAYSSTGPVAEGYARNHTYARPDPPVIAATATFAPNGTVTGVAISIAPPPLAQRDGLPVVRYDTFENAPNTTTWSLAHSGTDTSFTLADTGGLYHYRSILRTAAWAPSAESNIVGLNLNVQPYKIPPPTVYYDSVLTCSDRANDYIDIHLDQGPGNVAGAAYAQSPDMVSNMTAVSPTLVRLAGDDSLLGQTFYYQETGTVNGNATTSQWSPAFIPRLTPITNLRATVLPDNTVLLQWTPPATANSTNVLQVVVWALPGRPPAGGYIAHPGLSGSLFHTYTADPHTNTLTIPSSSLSRGTVYDFLVGESTCLDPPNDVHWNMAQWVEFRTLDVPTKPKTPTVGPGTRPEELLTNWETPAWDGGANITQYDLIWSITGPNGTYSPMITDPPALPHTDAEENVNPYPTYCVKVRADNSVGHGPYSDPGCGKPLPRLPGKPSIHASTGAVPTTIDVSWSDSDAGGGTIHGWDLFAAMNRSGPFGRIITQSPLTATTDFGLPNGAWRYYYVVPFNEAGAGPKSDVAEARTIDYPTQPTHLTATGGDKRIVLTWYSPADNGGSPITGYKVVAKQVGGASATQTITLGNVLTYTLSGLNFDDTWKFNVTARNILGYGPPASAQAKTFGLPSAPTPVMGGVSRTRGRINVTWGAPDNGGYAITSYKVYDASGTFLTSRTRLDYNQTGLGDGVSKRFRISAVNLAGEGPKSPAVNASTPDKPDPPRDLTLSVRTIAGIPIGNVTLNWLPPMNDGGLPLTRYDVYNSTDTITWRHNTTATSNMATLRPCSTDVCYYYVTASNVIGESDPSNNVSTRAQSAFPPESIRGTTPGAGASFAQQYACADADQDKTLNAGSVNLVSGQFLQTVCLLPSDAASDATFPGLSVPIEVTHRENAQTKTDLGTNWFLNVDRRLDAQGGNVVLTDGSGRFDQFNASGSSYASPPGYYEKLTHTASGYTLEHTGGVKELFDTAGRRTSIVDVHGNNVTFSYSGGQLLRMQDALGRNVTFEYNGKTLVGLHDWSGRNAAFNVTGKDLNWIRLTDGSRLLANYSFSYDHHNLVDATNGEGQNVLHNTYDVIKRVKTQKVPSGIWLFGYDYANNTSNVTDLNGNLVAWHYVSQVRPVPVNKTAYTTHEVRDSDPPSFVTTFKTNAQLEITNETDPDGASDVFVFDSNNTNPLARGNLLEHQTSGPGVTPLVVRATYEATYQKLHTVVTTDGTSGNAPENGGSGGAARYTTLYCYGQDETANGDLNGDAVIAGVGELASPVKVIEPAINAAGAPYPGLPSDAKQISYYAYNARGQPSMVVNANGDITILSYYQAGDPDATGPTGNHPPGTLRGHRVFQVDLPYTPPTGGSGCTDPPIPQPSGPGLLTTYDYDARGYVTSMTDPRNMTTKWTRDAAGRALTQTDPNNVTRTTNYNAEGQVLNETIQSYAWNADGTLRTLNATTNKFVYDAAGRKTDEYLGSPSPTGLGSPLHAEVVHNHLVLDKNGNVLAEYDQAYLNGSAPDHVTTHVYNERNMEVQRVVGGQNAVFARLNPGIAAPQFENYYLRDPAATPIVNTNVVNVPPIAPCTTLVPCRPSASVSSTGVQANVAGTPISFPIPATILNLQHDAPTSDSPMQAYSTASTLGQLPVIGSSLPATWTATFKNPAWDGAQSSGHVRAQLAFWEQGVLTPSILNSVNLPLGQVAPTSTPNTWTFTLILDNTTTYQSSLTYPPIKPGEIEEQRITLTNDLYIPPIAAGSTWRHNLTLTVVGPASASMLYDSPRTPTRIELGHATTQTTDYTKGGRVARSVDGEGHVTTYGYDAYGRPTNTTDMVGNRQVTKYDAAGHPRVMEAYGPVGATGASVLLSRVVQSYDEAGRLFRVDQARFNPTTGQALPDTGITPNDGNATTFYAYDLDGNPTKRILDDGTVQTRAYDHAGHLVHSTDGSEAGLLYTWGNNGTLDSVTATNEQGNGNYSLTNRTYLFSYDGNGNLIRTVDPLGHTTYSGYDSKSRLVWTTDARGGPMSDWEHRYNGSINGAGNLVTYDYDGQDHLVQETHYVTNTGRGDGFRTGQVTTRQVWNGDGQLAQQISNDGQVTTYAYDAQGNLATETSPTHLVRQAVYDAAGNLVQVQLPDGLRINQTFDPRNLLVKRNVYGPMPWSTIQTFAYDGLDRLIDATDNNLATNPLDDSDVKLAYDSTSAVMTETQNNKAIQIGHDGVGHETSLVYPSGLAVQRTYDAAGRPSAIKEGATAVAQYAYDSGRLASRTLANGVVTQAAYDAADRLTRLQIQSANFVMGYNDTFDEDGRVTSQIVRHAPEAGFLANYDSLGRMTSYVGGNIADQNEVLFPIRAMGPTSWNWNLDGQDNWLTVTQRTGLGASSSASASYNAENQATTPSSLWWIQSYSDNGNLQLEYGQNRNATSPDRYYEYDAFNRLREVHVTTLTPASCTSALPCVTVDFCTPVTLPTGQVTVVCLNNCRVAANHAIIACYTCFDQFQGQTGVRPCTDAECAAVPNNWCQHPTFDHTDTAVMNYTYDALNRRVNQTTTALGAANTGSAVGVWNLYDGANLIEQRYSNGTILRFVQGAGVDEHVALDQQGGSVHYYVQDRQGDVVALTDASGRLSEAYLYQPYGNLTVIKHGANGRIDWGWDDVATSGWSGYQQASSLLNPFYYTGQVFDAATNLYYYRARYYEPATGRFLTQDPIGVWGDRHNFGNGYAYVASNPLTFTDPFGLSCGWFSDWGDCASRAVGWASSQLTTAVDGIKAAGRWAWEHRSAIIKTVLVAGAVVVLTIGTAGIADAVIAGGAAIGVTISTGVAGVIASGIIGGSSALLVHAAGDCIFNGCNGGLTGYAGAFVAGAIFGAADKAFDPSFLVRVGWGAAAGLTGDITDQSLGLAFGDPCWDWTKTAVDTGLGGLAGALSKIPGVNEGAYNYWGRFTGALKRGGTLGIRSARNVVVGWVAPTFLLGTPVDAAGNPTTQALGGGQCG